MRLGVDELAGFLMIVLMRTGEGVFVRVEKRGGIKIVE